MRDAIKSQSATKTAGKTARRPRRVPQPNGSALYSGGVPGNAGGTGRPSSELRARLRGMLDERVTVLEEIASRGDASDGDRIRAIDTMLRYSVGQLTGVPDEVVTDKLRATVAIIRSSLPAEQAAAVLDRIKAVWAG